MLNCLLTQPSWQDVLKHTLLKAINDGNNNAVRDLGLQVEDAVIILEGLMDEGIVRKSFYDDGSPIEYIPCVSNN